MYLGSAQVSPITDVGTSLGLLPLQGLSLTALGLHPSPFGVFHPPRVLLRSGEVFLRASPDGNTFPHEVFTL